MSEARPPLVGVTVTTLKDGAGGGGKSTAAPKKASTVRIEVKLETRKRNGDTYEFCYPDLLKQAVKNLKMTEAANKNMDPSATSSGPGVLKPMRDPDDPLAAGQDDAEAKQLADYFEKKYGGVGGGAKKKGKKRKFDFQDYGMGYDETDPFVDNSEACDELMPNNLTTKMGGFYVNTGQLELREVSDAEEGEEEEDGGSDGEDEDESSSSSSEMEDDDERAKSNNKKRRRRPVIRDDDDDDDDGDDVDDDDDEDRGEKSASVNGGSQQQQQQQQQQRPGGSSSSAAALMLAKKNKRLKMQQQMSKRKKFLAAAGIEGNPLKGVVKKSNNDHSGGGGKGGVGAAGGGVGGGEKKKKTLTVSEMLRGKVAKGDHNAADGKAAAAAAVENGAVAAARQTEASSAASLMDNIIDAVIHEPFANDKGKPSSAAGATAPAASSASSGDSGPTSPIASAEAVADMPVDVSDNLKAVVEKLKAFAAASGCKGGEGKKKFFTPQVNELLLTVENECRSKSMRPGLRTRVYAHLAHHLPCNKETLIKRARNLKTAAEAEDVSTMIKRLKFGIDAVMPDIQAKYKAECDKAAEAKGVAAAAAAPVGDSAAVAAAAVESGDPGGNGGVSDNAKKIYAPRKKFLWRRDMRENFFAIVRGKLKEYFAAAAAENVGAAAAADPDAASKVDEFLKDFLEKEIKTLWPKGWMNERVLMKESLGLVNDCLREQGIAVGSSAQDGAALAALPATSLLQNPPTICNALPACLNGATTSISSISSAPTNFNDPQLPPSKLLQQQQQPPSHSTSSASSKQPPLALFNAPQQQQPHAASSAQSTAPAFSMAPPKDFGLDLSASSGRGGDSGVAKSSSDVDLKGLDLTKAAVKTTDAEKAVQKSLEFALHQAQIQQQQQHQQHISLSRADGASTSPVNVKQHALGNGGTNFSSNASPNSLSGNTSARRSPPAANSSSNGKSADKTPNSTEQIRQPHQHQQQQQQKQIDSLPASLGISALTQQQQVLAQQQLQKLLNASNSSLSQQHQNVSQPKSNPVVAPRSSASPLHNVAAAALPATQSMGKVSAIVGSNVVHSKVSAFVATSNGGVPSHLGSSSSSSSSSSSVVHLPARPLSTSPAKSSPSSMPPPPPSTQASSAANQNHLQRGYFLPPGRANLPSVPLIQPSSTGPGKGSSSSPPSTGDASGNNGHQRTSQQQQQRQQQPPPPLAAPQQQQQQRLSPTVSPHGPPPPEVHRGAPATSPLKSGVSTSPLSLVGGNISPHKSPNASLINVSGQLSPHGIQQQQPLPPHQPHQSSPRTPSPQKTQQPSHPIPTSHAGFLSQQVVQAMTPQLGTFASIGASVVSASSAKSTAPMSSSSSIIGTSAPMATNNNKSTLASYGNSFSLPKAVDVVSSMPISSGASLQRLSTSDASSSFGIGASHATGGIVSSSAAAVASVVQRVGGVSSSSSNGNVERPAYKITSSLQGGTVVTAGTGGGESSLGGAPPVSHHDVPGSASPGSVAVQLQQKLPSKQSSSSVTSLAAAAPRSSTVNFATTQKQHGGQSHSKPGNTPPLKQQQWQHPSKQAQQMNPQVVQRQTSLKSPAHGVQKQQPALQSHGDHANQQKSADLNSVPQRNTQPPKVPSGPQGMKQVGGSQPLPVQQAAQPSVAVTQSGSIGNPQQLLQMVQQQQQQGVLQQHQLQQLQLQIQLQQQQQQQQQNSLAYMQGQYKPQ